MSKFELKFLIIDDDPIFHLMVSKILENLGVTNIKSILDPIEGLNFLLRNQNLPDILLLDINMPKLSGWELLDSLRNLDLNKLNIYIVTSSIDRYDKNKSNDYNIINFLKKPLKPDTLRKILAEL